ncbi:MAG: hypothetical protein DSO02_03405 [Hadesarchaea archaeon]|nr:MAG: hypothetical protein DSO03_01860 [Hadesarchaea archaeon]TDA33853.1 MAG: hypothetical protein DSO02_03405 [Hadesarchaea archaeon]
MSLPLPGSEGLRDRHEKAGGEKGRRGETIGERLLALVECNSCFTDGVQVATGCTLGNNCLT